VERPVLSAAFRDALSFAAALQDGQVKKGTAVPYISHLLSVCALVLEHGGDEEEAIAALLHDVLEDHPEKVTRDELRARFGPRVAAIVESCTDTPADYGGGPKASWGARKRQHVERLRREGSPSTLVVLADKLHNARAIASDYRRLGEAVWSRFKAGRDGQLWYFRELAGVFREIGAPARMLEEFDDVIAELERLAEAASQGA
jgi:(p)ppGpp synthase/HD superfamily hydrolase